MPGRTPMNASIWSGLRRMSLVRSAALRSGLAKISAMRSLESVGVPDDADGVVLGFALVQALTIVRIAASIATMDALPKDDRAKSFMPVP
jgi:hypothetical protein